MKNKIIFISIIFIITIIILSMKVYKTQNMNKNYDFKINNSKTLEELISGVVLLYNDDCQNCDKLLNTFSNLSNKYNTPVTILNLNNKKHKEQYNDYKSKNKDEIMRYQKAYEYNLKIRQLKFSEEQKVIERNLKEMENLYGKENLKLKDNSIDQSTINKYEELKKQFSSTLRDNNLLIQQKIEEAVSTRTHLRSENNGVFPMENKNIILNILRQIEPLQRLSLEELYSYIEILDNEKNSSIVIDGKTDNLPRIYVVYEKLLVKTYDNERINAELMNKPSNLEKFLINEVGLNNFSNINEIQQLKSKINNKEDFIVFYYGNSCDECVKLKPIIERINYDIDLIDMYIVKNQIEYHKLEESDNLSHIDSVPLIIAYNNGQETDILTHSEWTNQDSSINKQNIIDFIKKHQQ